MEFSFISDCGLKRESNEDYGYAKVFSYNNNDIGIFIVADGMGGHSKGEVASKMAVDIIKDKINEKLSTDIADHFDIRLILQEAFYSTNAAVYSKSIEEPELRGMGTTLIAAVIYNNDLFVGNIGDSRAYVLKGNKLSQITEDNSYVQELVKSGAIKPEEAKNHPKKNIITRAVGTDEYVKTDIYNQTLNEGDWLVLCSDGLTNMLEDNAIENILISSHDAKDCCGRLVSAANAGGGTDNITSVCVIL